MDWKLEVVEVPVSDLDRARAFYADQLGFSLDIDDQISDDVRLIQLTPPGSGCSIHLRLDATRAGSVEGLLMVVPDLHLARKELLEGRVDVGEVQEFDRKSGTYRVSTQAVGWNAFVFFKDPDGNGWVVQQRGS
jgi:catechol 2,3-dioxygenase-like lactoylglutathione lyase family enzyme